MNKISDEARLLGKYRIDTDEQLILFKESRDEKINELTKDRMRLYGRLQRMNVKGNTSLEGKIRDDISAINTRLKSLRKEVKVCEGILERKESLKTKTEQIKEEREETQRILTKVVQLNPANEENFYKHVEYFLQKLCVDGGAETLLTKAVAYIGENYMRYDLSLEEVANVVGISKTQMSKLFRNKVGIRYIDYLTKLRMEKAKQLLEETELSVKSILLDVGYIDKTNFSKKFKEYYGVNASSYRKQAWEHKENEE